MDQYLVQFGVIILPICIYQIWTFLQSSSTDKLRTWVLGMYGGGSAILCQLTPITILHVPENFQCVPVILSILYGKRTAGLFSVGILSAYQIFVADHLVSSQWVPSVLAILVYSAIPMMVCLRFDRFDRQKRYALANLLSMITLVVELLFVLVFFLVTYGKNGFAQLSHYVGFLGVASLVQVLLMAVSFFLLENIREHGRMRQRFKSLVDYNPVGICTFDMNHRFVAVNEAYEAITGYTEAELLGKSRLTLWFPENRTFAQGLVDYLLDGNVKQGVEVTIRHKDGHPIDVRFTLVPIREGDMMVGYFGMVTDMTESNVAQEILRNSDRLSAIGELAAGVAHEIRNPLTSIKGFLQMLSTSASSEQSRYFDIMKSELSRIEGIVSEMLVLAKPHAVSLTPVDLIVQVQDVVDLVAAEANMHSVEIAVELNPIATTMNGDGNQLKQVFLNVSKNAIEAMPDGGKLTIRVRLENRAVIVEFEDTGEGMPEDVLKKVGEPFYTTKSKGTGLGLLVSKRIVANHNGRFTIRSTRGQGTTVSIALPIQSSLGSGHEVAATARAISRHDSVPVRAN